MDLEGIAGTLPYGDQRRLEVARALAARPKILMLDEPAVGMNPIESKALAGSVRAIAASGIGVLMIEHDVPLVRSVSNHIVVLNFGTLLAEGPPDEVTRNPEVIEAYLGSAV